MTSQTHPSGLYRTKIALSGHEEEIPEEALVFLGYDRDKCFVVRPRRNHKNRWFWGGEVTAVQDQEWLKTLIPLRHEGYYTLHEAIHFENGGSWLENAIVQLGYNPKGQAILFVAEEHEAEDRNALFFSHKGYLIEDAFMNQLRWAPILPVSPPLAPVKGLLN